MFLNRCAYLLALLLLSAAAVLSGNALFALLAALCVAVAMGSLILWKIAVRRLRVRIALPESAAKDEEIQAKISLSAGPLIGCMHLRLRGRAVNLLCGDELSFEIRSPEETLRIASPHCGRLRVEIHRAEIADPLNLFRKKICLTESAAALILPDAFEIAVELAQHDLPNPESDDYSPDRPGGDPSELFGIRNYREGDAMKSIHWKLSEKYDRTVVHEASLPVSHAILLLLDNCPKAAVNPDDVCAACEALISCSLALADAGVPHRIAWINRELGILETRDIAQTDDLYGEQGALLAARCAPDASGLAARLIDQDMPEYSRLLIFAAAQTEGLAALDGRATLLLPQANPEGAVSCLREALAHLTV